jgi:predicted esterase
VTPETKTVPLLMCHGQLDPVVRFAWGTKSKEKLEASGVSDIEFRVYPDMQHSACMEEIDDIKRWLKRVLPKDA